MEADAFDVAGFVEALLEFGEALDFAFRKNEAMVGGLPGDSFVFMQFEECGGIAEVALFALAAVCLDFAELAEVLLELAGEALAVEAEGGEEAVGVDDVEGDGGFFIGRVGGAREKSASSSGMRLMRQAVSASSWTSWDSVGVAGWYSSWNWPQWCW